jgi:excisionase family DNA binding protein
MIDKVYGRLYRMADDEFISTTEAAARLGVTRQRVLQLIENGRLDAKKFANVYMIRLASLENIGDRKPGRPPQAKTGASKAEKKAGNRKRSKYPVKG